MDSKNVMEDEIEIYRSPETSTSNLLYSFYLKIKDGSVVGVWSEKRRSDIIVYHRYGCNIDCSSRRKSCELEFLICFGVSVRELWDLARNTASSERVRMSGNEMYRLSQ